MRQIQPVTLILILILSQSCRTEQSPMLPNPSGKPGEVLLVMDKYLWESRLGEYMKELTGQPYEVVPQYEPIYDLIQIPASALNNIFKQHRNIIMTKISDQFSEPSIIVQHDVWSKYQLLVNLAGPNEKQVLTYLRENGEKLIRLLNQAELNRTFENYKKNRAKGIDELLKKNHHCSISVPAGYDVGLDTTNFVWLTHEIADMIQGVLIYYYEYKDPDTFTPEYLREKRDEFTRRFVPGAVPGSYMVIEDQVPVQVREMARDSTYLVEMRGLFRMEKAFMGGPFISHTFLDERRNRIITVDGFVHAPGLEKRNYLRELEAILHSFNVAD